MLSTTGTSSSSARPCRTPSIVGVRESTDPLIILLYWERLHPGKRWGTLSWLPCRFSVSCEVTSGSLPSPCSHFFAITMVQKEFYPVKTMVRKNRKRQGRGTSNVTPALPVWMVNQYASYFADRDASLLTAAVLPAPMALTTVCGPVTASPPANTPGRLVLPFSSVAMPPH